jgi:hypothetical protein
MTGSGLLVTSSENKPSSAPSRTYWTVEERDTKQVAYMQSQHALQCIMHVNIRREEGGGGDGKERRGEIHIICSSHLVTGCVHDAAQFKCSGHPLNILEKWALLSDSEILFLRD